MKKAELHVHLEGSIGPETLMAIDPSLTREEIEANLTCGSFSSSCRVTYGLARNSKSPSIMPWRRATYSIRWPRQEVTYAEITLSAGVVLWKQQDLAAVYDAVWRESQAIFRPDVLDSGRDPPIRPRKRDGGGPSSPFPGAVRE